MVAAALGVLAGCTSNTGMEADEPCASGTHDDDGDAATACVAWTVCRAGEFVATAGDPVTDRECDPCAQGTFTTTTNAPACRSRTTCREGEYVSAAGSAVADQVCTGCTSGTFSESADALACEAWTTCVEGEHIAAAGSASVDQICAVCPTGTHTTGPNQAVCVPLGECSPGARQTVAGTSDTPPTCVACSAGEYCAGGDAAAIACDSGDGTWDHDLNPSTACVARTVCVAGTYVSAAGNATSDRSCTVCPSGSFSEVSNANACTAFRTCAPGQHVSLVGSATRDRACTDCPSGSFASGTNTPSCTTWTVCAAGQSVSTDGSATGDRSCAGCTSGTFSDVDNATNCAVWTDCVTGQFVVTPGSDTSDRVCGACAAGTITTGPNQTTCVDLADCAPGTVQVVPGTMTTPPTCVACSAGEYCAGGETGLASCVSGTWDHDADPATACVNQTVCVAGSFVAAQGDTTTDRSCSPCASGSFSDTPNATSCAPWTTCPAGQYVSVVGGPGTDQVCMDCEDASFSDMINAATCTTWSTCVAGQYEDHPGSALLDRVCTGCATGTFSVAINATDCDPWRDCSAGMYVSNTPSDTVDRVCEDCAAGTYTDGANRSMCVAHGACVAGTVQTAAGTATMAPLCDLCAPGQYCAGGVTPPTACGSDTWDHDADAATVCTTRTDCGAGQYVTSSGDATTDRTCAVCVDGSYNTMTNASVCGAWTSCPAGEYVSTPGSATADRVCTSCLLGTFSDVQDAPACVLWTACEPGYVEGMAGSAVTDRACVEAGWTRQFGTSSYEYARSVAVDAAGNVYVTGFTGGTFAGEASSGSNDGYLRKYDSAGTVLWTRQFGTAAVDNAQSVGVDAMGNVYVAGWTNGTFAGQSGAANSDGFLLKYSDTGTLLWTRQFGTAGYDTVYAAYVDGSGNVYVAGETTGNFTGVGMSAGSSDGFVRKYSSAGTTLWTRQFGTAGSDGAAFVSVDGAGAVYVVGYTNGTFTGETSAGSVDAFMLKYTGAGVLLRTHQFGTAGADYGTAVAVDALGNAYVVGRTSGALAGEPTAGMDDGFAQKYAADGTLLWTRQLGTPARESVGSVGVDGSGNVYVVGYTRGSFMGHASSGLDDGFAQRYDTNGALVWTRQFGTAAQDVVDSVTVGGSGSVYAAGRTAGTFPGQSSAGIEDGFVMELANP